MEDFFRKLALVLKEKLAAYNSDNYQPFLGNIVVDVISPGHREVSIDVAIVDRLDSISSRLSKMESRRAPPSRASNSNDSSITNSVGNTSYYTAKGDHKSVLLEFTAHPNVIEVEILGSEGLDTYFAVKIGEFSSDDERDQIRFDLKKVARQFSCSEGIRSSVLRTNGW